MLKFSPANSKTKNLMQVPAIQKYLQGKRKVYSLDLLSGWSCPAAQDCLAKVVIENNRRRLVDGPFTEFRCFSASQEVLYPKVYDARKHNFDIVRKTRGHHVLAELIVSCLPKNVGVLRWHVAGDFFKLDYLRAAIEVARYRPDVLFYAYTKMINHLCSISMLDPANGVILDNFLVTGSYGGKYDHLLGQSNLRTAQVVFSEMEAGQLPIDHDDSHAATKGGHFALLLHGVQPAGTPAAQALKALKGKGSYSR